MNKVGCIREKKCHQKIMSGKEDKLIGIITNHIVSKSSGLCGYETYRFCLLRAPLAISI